MKKIQRPSKLKLRKIAEGHRTNLAAARKVCPIPLKLPTWTPRRFRRYNDIQIVTSIEPVGDLPKGYIVTWYDPKHEELYFKLIALVVAKKGTRAEIKKQQLARRKRPHEQSALKTSMA